MQKAVDKKSPDLSAQDTKRHEAFLIGVYSAFNWMFNNLYARRGPELPRLHKRRRGWLSGLVFYFYIIKVGLSIVGKERLHRVVRSLQPRTLIPDRDCWCKDRRL